MDRKLSRSGAVPQESAAEHLDARPAHENRTAGRIHRLLVISSHPVPYAAPAYRLMTQQVELEILVAYCSVGPTWDSEFGRKLAWDVPLLDGYHWVRMRNWSLRPGLRRFFGLINPGIWKLISAKKFDAVAVHGYAYCSFWIAFLAAKIAGVPVLLGTDATTLRHPSGGWWWKRWLKTPIVRFIYTRLADIVLVPSTATRRFLNQLGIPEEKIVLTPYSVDNDYFARGRAAIDQRRVRQDLALPENSFAILYCGKLIDWKRPEDVLRALAILNHSQGESLCPAYALLAGDGASRRRLESLAQSLGIGDRVRFLGFVNQSKLPELYAAADVLVLPSESEAWGVVVNEAMSCGIPAIVSDRVGAGLDLVSPGLTGDVYPVGDVQALACCLRKLLLSPMSATHMGRSAREKMTTWSYRENVEGWIQALKKILPILVGVSLLRT